MRSSITPQPRWTRTTPSSASPPWPSTSAVSRTQLMGCAHPTSARAAGTGGRGVSEARRIRSLYLPPLPGRPPGACAPLCLRAGPHRTLSMARLCVLADESPLPHPTPRLCAFVEQIPLRPGIIRQPCANRGRLARSFDNLLEIPSGEEIPIVRQQSGGTFLSRAKEAALEELL